MDVSLLDVPPLTYAELRNMIWEPRNDALTSFGEESRWLIRLQH